MREDLHVLTGSYVLDAISDTEREEFERHLQHCPARAAEVRGMRETAARLAAACPPAARGGARAPGPHARPRPPPAAVRRPPAPAPAPPPGPAPAGPFPPRLP